MKKPIICIHGIRRQERWFDTLKNHLYEYENKNSNVEYFIEVFENKFWSVFRLIFPWWRERKIKEFQEFYLDIRKRYNEIPHLVCHSFGSYIFFKSIQKYEEIKFDKVIMVGSILDPNIKWDEFFKKKQINKMLHEYGKKDWIVKFAKFLEDGGNSGEIGFSNIRKNSRVDKRMIQKELDKYGHSDYFYPLHIKESWIPFLTDINLPYNPKILRDEVIKRLYSNIKFFKEKNNNLVVDEFYYKARIDKDGNYFLNYLFKGQAIDSVSNFYFQTIADSNKNFEEEDIIVFNKERKKLDLKIDEIETFKIVLRIECDETLEKHDDYEININLKWDKAINFNIGDTDHFAIQDFKKGIIELNFPYKLKNAFWFIVKNEDIVNRKKAIFKEKRDGSFSYIYKINNNEDEENEGIIFYFEKSKKDKNTKKIEIQDTVILKRKFKDKNIIFKYCDNKDISKIYILEKELIEMENAATEETLRKRLELFPYGFIVAYDGDKIIGYVESVLFNDWNFETFNEIKEFEKFYDINSDTLYIIFIAVHPEYRGLGIASEMLKIVENVARKFNVKKIKLISKDEAIKLYKNNGFYVKDNIKNFLPDTPINAIMIKEIN